MSALSHAPAPTSGVHWADLLTPLKFALTDCYLSYKQNALLPPLCFQLLADPFAFPNRVKSFKIKQIQTLLTKHPGWGYLRSVPSVLRTPCSLCCAFSCSCRLAFSATCSLCVVSLRSFAHPFPLFSATSSLFSENTRVGVGVALSRRHSPRHCAAWESTQCLIYSSRRLRGTAPCSRIASWNARMLNLGPRRRSASARSSRILSWPSL